MAAHSAETESDDLLVLLEQVLWAHRPEFRFIRDGLSRTMSEIYRTIANRQAEDLSPTDLQRHRQLAKLLQQLLESHPPPATRPPDPSESTGDPVLQQRLDALVDATSHHTHAETRPAAGATTAQVWEWLHLQALRLPAAMADRLRADAAAAVGARSSDGLVPRCDAVNHPGWDGDPELWAKLTEQLTADEVARYHELLEPLAAVLGVLSRSTDILSAHRLDGQKAGIVLTSAEQRLQYVQRAIKAAAKLSGLEGPYRFEEVQECDECTRSVLPWPRPAPGSWWDDCGDRSLVALHGLAQSFDAELEIIRVGQTVDPALRSKLADGRASVFMRVPPADEGRVLWNLAIGYTVDGRGRSGRVLVGERD